MTPEELCPECFGKTVLFRGKGLDSEWYVCSQWEKPGHLTLEQIRERIKQVSMAIRPSGRFA